MLKEILLPDLGEGVEGGTIIGILVSPGDNIEENDTVLEIETDKATVEVPSTEQGIIDEIFVEVGTEITAGQKIFKMKVKEANQQILGLPEKIDAPFQGPSQTRSVLAELKPQVGLPTDTAQGRETAIVARVEKRDDEKKVHALPLTRRFAREIGIDLTEISISDGSLITIQGVKAFARLKNKQPVGRNILTKEQASLPDFEKQGQVETKPLSRIRKATSLNMTNSWQRIPHVTIFNKAHIDEVEVLRQNLKVHAAEKGIPLTITAILVKVLALALQKFSEFNVSLDFEKGELLHKHYINVGVATDSPTGLIVPVIRGADTKRIIDLASEIKNYSVKAQERKIAPGDLQGGCITLSNLGKVNNTGFTPIINWPEVAILGVSKSAIEPVYVDKTFTPQLMLPLSLSFDHRVINGMLAATFLQYIVETLENPLTMML